MEFEKADNISAEIHTIIKSNLFSIDYSKMCLNGIILIGILEQCKARILDTLKENEDKNSESVK